MESSQHRKPAILFGTPLSRSLENDATHHQDDDCPTNRRRFRLDRQQIVKDEQRRRRFHGAFTGGFSAGYHNSVDTIQGFQPKSFVSRRGDKRDHVGGGHSGFHQPEDYMDDEDFGEFGIAQKKIRITPGFSDSSQQFAKNRATILKPVVKDSVGEKILRCMTGENRLGSQEDVEDLSSMLPKNDYHGLGYKSLNHRGHQNVPSSSDARTFCNPLEMTLKQGQKLKISGQAFGEGVLDDDDDEVYLHHADEYGYDSITNYEFNPIDKSSEQKPQRSTKGNDDTEIPKLNNEEGRCILDDFILAQDVDAMQICENGHAKYPLPVIPDDWKQPVREEPYVPPKKSDAQPKEDLDLFKKNAGKFNERFTSSKAATVSKCDNIEGRTGLVAYADLKTIGSKQSSVDTKEESNAINKQSGLTMQRETLEWRPYSLLCKHFNVPNPFPDNAYCGVKPSDLRGSLEQQSRNDTAGPPGEDYRHNELASMELRRSIFNITFEEAAGDADDEAGVSEDEPQVVDLDSGMCDMGSKSQVLRLGLGGSESEDDTSDIVVMEAPKKEPEVIVLSSSSSSSPIIRTRNSDESDADDEDAYGPPLPPSRRLLPPDCLRAPSSSSPSSANRSHSSRRRRKKKSKKNKKSSD